MNWIDGEQTASYVGITCNENLLFGVGSMNVFNHITPDTVTRQIMLKQSDSVNAF